MLIAFLNYMDIQLILEFKNSFEKYLLVFPKNLKFFGDMLYTVGENIFIINTKCEIIFVTL